MAKSDTVKNRSEILFLYDCKWMNPNGDPLKENKPRVDEETRINYVTDVRLKRTVRDYMDAYLGQKILIKERIKEDGNRKTKNQVLEEKKITSKKDILEFIDIRLFGSTILVQNKSKKSGSTFRFITTGPVQFNFGRSLHKVKWEYVKGYTVQPSDEKEQKAGSPTENYVLPYSLISFYGIINENAAKHTNLTDDDVAFLMEALWNGTKNLITRSKFGQTPRLMLQIQYKEDARGFYIGDLISKIAFIPQEGKNETEVRDISEGSLDISLLTDAINAYTNKINKILFKQDAAVDVLSDLEDKTKLEEFDF